MPLRDLREAYGKSSGSAREAINRAIRAELAGGNESLDALELLHKICRRQSPTGPCFCDTDARSILDRNGLRGIRHENRRLLPPSAPCRQPGKSAMVCPMSGRAVRPPSMEGRRMMLHEKYRPKDWPDVIGQEKAVRSVEMLRKGGFGGRAILFTGGTGTGKTTLAKLIATEFANEWSTIELNARGISKDDVEALLRRTNGPCLGNGGWAVVVNEIQGLSKAVLTELLTSLEAIPSCTVWIFTTTTENMETLYEKYEDFRPFVGRCNRIALSQRGLAESFAKRAREIAQAEGMDGKPFQAYLRLVKDCRNSMRETLSQIETGAMLE